MAERITCVRLKPQVACIAVKLDDKLETNLSDYRLLVFTRDEAGPKTGPNLK